MIRICHISTVHKRKDIRIYWKQCVSLARAGYDVHLVIADGNGDEKTPENITIHDVGAPAGRITRFLACGPQAVRAALRLNPSVVELHDPELLAFAPVFRVMGIPVIFDSHENVPLQIRTKHWLQFRLLPFFPGLVSHFYQLLEKLLVRSSVAHVFSVHELLAARLSGYGKPVTIIRNLVQAQESPEMYPWHARMDAAAYVGGISRIRGIAEQMEACRIAGVTLLLAGKFAPPAFEQELRTLPAWNNTQFYGEVDRPVIYDDILAKAKVGLLVLYPTPNHLESSPNKLFEYMLAGIPVIASDFPYWRSVIENAKCGLLIQHPDDPEEIARAIRWVIEHPEEAEQMGRNGREAVLKEYHWGQEEKKLLSAYLGLCAKA